VENKSPVCVIGYEIAKRIFPRTNPLGQILSLTNAGRLSYPCRVVGVLTHNESNQEWSPPDKHIYVPYSYYQSVTDNWWDAQIHDVVLQLASGSDVEVGGKKIKAYFERKYGKAAKFMVDSDSTLIAQLKRFLTLFAVLLTRFFRCWWVASASTT
jgi:hypothetical protein